MKYTLIFIFFSLLNINPPTDYSGSWISAGDTFENTLTLEKIVGNPDTYKFSFAGWRESYDPFSKENIRFGGYMSEDFFTIEIIEGKANYSDDNRIESGEFPLYSEGEERCKLWFEFNDQTITVKSAGCHLIYGGRGVLFDGVYRRSQ